MKEAMLYQDNLIEIRNDSIILKHYYFPFISKKILFNNIEKIDTKEPTLINGKWRIWGTGSLTVWFPIDIFRPMRDEIFFITYKNKKIRSGFTVEDSEKVEIILKEKAYLSKMFS